MKSDTTNYLEYGILEEKTVPISKVQRWKKNPRSLQKDDLEALKNQIQQLGVYKRLLCFPKDGNFVTLGGNARLEALKQLGATEIAITVVHPKDEAEKIKYNLSDNDQKSRYIDEQLAELVYPHIDEIELKDFKVDLAKAIPMTEIVEGAGPKEEGQPEAEPVQDLDDETFRLTFDLPMDTKERVLELMSDYESKQEFFLGLLRCAEEKRPIGGSKDDS